MAPSHEEKTARKVLEEEAGVLVLASSMSYSIDWQGLRVKGNENINTFLQGATGGGSAQTGSHLLDASSVL